MAIGRGDELLGTLDLPAPHAPPRRSVDLTPTLDALCREHGAVPNQVGQAYLSIGPGSFTGLRIAVATAKMLAQVLQVELFAVPTLDVVAQNAPANLDTPHVAVCLNQKRDTAYAGVFERADDMWRPAGEPSLTTMAQLLRDTPRPLAILGDPLPPLPADQTEGVTVLDAALAVAHAEWVWRLGRDATRTGQPTDPATLVPLYVRPPEAVTLWDQRHGQGSA